MKIFTDKLNRYFYRPTDVLSIALFRIVFGIAMVEHVITHVRDGLVREFFVTPKVRFPYPLFEFLPDISEWAVYAMFVLMGVFAVLIALGWFYRIASVGFFVLFAYTFFYDMTFYNNHYYLILLLSFLFIFIDAHKRLSVDNFKGRFYESANVPLWNSLVLRIQTVIPYFFGGVAKINKEWLSGNAVRIQLEHMPHLPKALHGEGMVSLLGYGGLAFDLVVGMLLFYRKTRLFAIVGVVVFNLSNSFLFPISVFPYLMIGAVVLFLDPEQLYCLGQKAETFLRKVKINITIRPPAPSVPERLSSKHTAVSMCIVLYLLVQVCLPMRHYFYYGNATWTSEGIYYAWHMRMGALKGTFAMTVTDPETGQKYEVFPPEDVSVQQAYRLVCRPQMIWQYAQFIKTRYQKMGIKNPEVRVKALLSLNGRQRQILIDPDANLAEAEYLWWTHSPWIVPFEGAWENERGGK